MCWAFVDTWLEDPEKEAADQIKKEEMWEYIPAQQRRKKTKRYVVVKQDSVKPGSERVVQDDKEGNLWEYIPAASEKKSSKKCGKEQEVVVVKTSSKRESNGTDAKKTNNVWEYIPAAPSKKSSKPSSKKHDKAVSSLLPFSFRFLSRASFATFTAPKLNLDVICN